MAEPVNAAKREVQRRLAVGLGLDPPVDPKERSDGSYEAGSASNFRADLPWAEFVELWTEAEVCLACLEHDLATHELRPYWICRLDFQMSAAIGSLGGETVAMEDLVLVDAGAAPKGQTASWVMAKAMLAMRRHIAHAGPAKILTLDGILDLERRLTAALIVGSVVGKTTAPESQYQHVERWMDVVEELSSIPPLPAAAVALRAWRSIAPLPAYNHEIGLLLSSTLLWHWGKTKGLTACPIVGLQGVGLTVGRRCLDDRETLGAWIAQYCQAVQISAGAGQDNLLKMNQARVRAVKLLNRHRSNSRMPQMVRLFLSYPVMTTRFLSQRLQMSTQGADGLLKELIEENLVVETTGRAKNRAYRLA